jgi:hypothetical protein
VTIFITEAGFIGRIGAVRDDRRAASTGSTTIATARRERRAGERRFHRLREGRAPATSTRDKSAMPKASFTSSSAKLRRSRARLDDELNCASSTT